MGKSNKNQKIAILTDSGSSITPYEAEKLGIFLLPLQIIENDKSYNDLVDIDTQQIYKKIYDQCPLSTSLPVLSIIYNTIEKIKKEGYDTIIAIPLTSGISSTASVIQTVAAELSIPISLIYTYTTCQIQKYVVLRVKSLIDSQLPLNQILSIVNEEIDNSGTFILAGDLNHLKRGGRLTPLAASFANMMKIFPILKMDKYTEGKIDVFTKVRTKTKALKMLAENSISKDIENDIYYILHSDDVENANVIREILINKGVPINKISIEQLNSVIAVHVGMKCIAIQHIKSN